MSVLLGGFIPAKQYANFYECRSAIRKELKGKGSAIYLFYNLNDITKCYVGQSSNVLGRINNYLNNAFLNGHKNSNSPKALVKHGQSGFGFIILEYVPVADLGMREIHWIALLKPYYNVLSGGVTGSLGFVHSQETKDKLRAMRLGATHSEESKALISSALMGSNNPFFGATHTPENLLAISVGKTTGVVYVYNLF